MANSLRNRFSVKREVSTFGFDAQEDVNIEDFFEDAEPKEKEPKQIQCPHCGKWFEA